MPWSLRESSFNNAYLPAECPNYTNWDLFTIKIHGGGEFNASSGAYVGGTYRYVDNCDVNEMSFLEVATMLEEAFGHLGYCEFSYKLPNVDGLNSIRTDNDVVVMCTKLDLSRLVYVYAVTVNVEYTQEFQPSQQASLEYLDIPNVDGLDDEEIDVMLLENLAQQYDRVEEVENEAVVNDQAEVISDVEEGSFHDDSSNVDSTDDEKNDQASNAAPPESHKKKKAKVVKSKGKQVASKENNTMPNSNSEEARSNPNGEEINIQKVQGYSQGGIFTSYSQPARMENTTLGIQPQRFMVRGQYVTTLNQIEAEANARKAQMSSRPPWRL
ncbi:hypothetical protein POM88_048032 [Heracleum sosnowskyi]|uniref:PB1-like domain-containing protein n=1 Tax=Heracleum sosnowskyi TaxID=360622 RepID=A0AAD8GVG4_9APIA|nr:hypothetical protein POM88_048032 [Heracleum sosnowskyi]